MSTTLNTILGLIVAFALNGLSLYYVETAAGMTRMACMHDIGFGVLPQCPPGYGDALPYLFLAIVLATSQRWQYIKQASIIMAMRAITMAVTILPPSRPCIVDSLAILRGGCHDKIFSGHTAYMVLSVRHLWHHERWRPIMVILTALEATYLVASREHYSVDVVLAIIIAAGQS